VRDLVRLDRRDDVGALGVVVEHVVLDLVVILEAKIAIRALMDDDLVRHVFVLAPSR
jgi:hypothetical protein